MCIGILIPFATAIYSSLQRYRLDLPHLRKMNWGENYLKFLSDSEFWNTLQVSLAYTGLTVGLELLLGLGIALLLQRSTRFNNFVSILLLLPLMTAPALAALMWKLMTNPNFGILSYGASLVGLEDMKWASDPSTALLTVLLVDIWVYTPFMMILLLAGLRSLPRQPFEAAALDGVPRTFVFLRITLPMLTPYIITASLFRLLDSMAGLLAFIFAWNNFIFALVLASADKQPVTVGALAFVTASGIQYGQIAAAIVVAGWRR